MKVHILKTWPVYFERVDSGDKTFEVRKNDRDFQTGDEVLLKEYDPVKQEYTFRQILFTISYILYGGDFGIENGYCVLGLKGRR